MSSPPDRGWPTPGHTASSGSRAPSPESDRARAPRQRIAAADARAAPAARQRRAPGRSAPMSIREWVDSFERNFLQLIPNLREYISIIRESAGADELRAVVL